MGQEIKKNGSPIPLSFVSNKHNVNYREKKSAEEKKVGNPIVLSSPCSPVHAGFLDQIIHLIQLILLNNIQCYYLESQGRKRKTLLSYFSTSDASPATTPNVTTTPSAAPISIHDPLGAPTAATITHSAPPTVTTSPIDLASLERDPGLRRPIWMYPPNVRDDITREYIRLGACQPKLKKDQYPSTEFGNQRRRFQAFWFNSWCWLEYSISKDAAFCFPCFLFEKDSSSQHAFTIDGFKNWKRVNDNERCLFFVHIGGDNSLHKKAVKSLEGLTDITRHIDKVINRQSLEEINNNRLRLRATIEVVRYLNLQACALRGHDESSTSRNRGDCKYCILVDETIDESHKEQMAIVLRFVDVHDFIRERFFDIVNVADTISLTLKKEIFDVLTRNNLSIHNMRGQGYDGSSNMRGAFNDLQALFLKDCPYAYYVHCFAHRLQLALAAHGIEVENSVASGERETGRGLNQIGNLQRSGSTRWSSHFNCVCSLMDKFGSIIVVLENINNCSTSSNSMRGEVRGSLKALKSFDFLFVLHLMYKIKGITDLLCRALQSKSIDILNVMDSVATTIVLLQSLRNEGFDILLDYVMSVCAKYKIDVPHMNARYMDGIRSLKELHYRFNDTAVQLLRLSSSLELKNNFMLFDIEHI
ncbi:uncharacterized protein LOC141664857 [Apium graveolens]|uniref:uncharacterized protein LOC141664857 n=1 Tax=Apium graveolens TaxID=4045 RepID=UPI003D79A87F